MRKAFTLIELILVIAIIGILATIILSQVIGARVPVMIGVIKAELNNLKIAVSSMVNDDEVDLPPGKDFGPKTEADLVSEEYEFEDSGNTVFFKLISGKGGRARGGANLFPFKKERYKPSTKDPNRMVYLDPFNRPYIYKCPGEINKRACDLYSMGPNGIDDGGIYDKSADKDDILMDWSGD